MTEELHTPTSELPNLDSLRDQLTTETDLAEKKRIQTTLQILSPIIKHKDDLGLTSQQLSLIASVAEKTAQLEAGEIKAETEKGTIHALDQSLLRISNTPNAEPGWNDKLAKGAKVIRDAVLTTQRRASEWVDKFKDDKYKNTEDFYREWFHPDPEKKHFGTPLDINYFVDGADKSLTIATLQELGVLEETEGIDSLAKKVSNPQKDIYQTSNLTNYRRLPTALPELTAEVYNRFNGTSYDISLNVTGDAAMQMVTSEIPPSPFENN